MQLIHDPITFILICLVCHFYADFNLQIGAQLHEFKQKEWWVNLLGSEKNEAYKKEWNKYGHDYIAALLIHAFVWSVVTFLPYFFTSWYQPKAFLFIVIDNAVLHALVDHEKCNKLRFNLIQDQFVHLVQVVSTCLFLWYIAT